MYSWEVQLEAFCGLFPSMCIFRQSSRQSKAVFHWHLPMNIAFHRAVWYSFQFVGGNLPDSMVGASQGWRNLVEIDRSSYSLFEVGSNWGLSGRYSWWVVSLEIGVVCFSEVGAENFPSNLFSINAQSIINLFIKIHYFTLTSKINVNFQSVFQGLCEREKPFPRTYRLGARWGRGRGPRKWSKAKL